MIKSMVYYGNTSIGEVELWPKGETNLGAASWAREIRVDRLSPPSERCVPLVVLHTVAVGARCLVMESRPLKAADEPPPPLVAMHAACLRDNKTAVVSLGEEELHLVAMTSRRNLMNQACFWGYKVPFGLYNSCLTMLNLRCLGIVFDLDETLIVANTTRSFEDRIDSLQRKLNNETDPQRINGMLAEIKRYQDDKSILKQYIEGDQVYDDGKMYKVQPEIVPPLSDNRQSLTRPVIRLQEKNIILTRINPSIRDTSVLVRLRPAWEDLRSYLIARGRKRFEVYVCTMAERDYALEMWRLLDPDSRLINSVQLSDRMVCVKSGLRKSLLNVFHDGSCHPGMALIIDDRLKVWDEKDQSRVHVVPAFTPYYAPQAEANFSIPVLCVARNVACNVRGGFFKDFDEALLPRISNVVYEDVIHDIPSAPDVGNYLISEEASGAGSALNPIAASFVMPVAPGQNFVPSSVAPFATPPGMMPLINSLVPQPPFSQPVAQAGLLDPLQGSPAREEGEVPESELDPDTRRRLLILQHGQDTRDPTPPLPAVPPVQVPVPPVQPNENWYPVEDGMNPNNLNRGTTGFPVESVKQPPQPSYFHGGDNNPVSSDRFNYQNQRFPPQLTHAEDDHMLQNPAPPRFRSFPGQRNNQIESGQNFARNVGTSVGILEEIAPKSGSKVEYRSTLCDTTELQFSIEVWIVGERVGEGIGGTRREAQWQAAEMSLRNLANKYLLSDPNKITDVNENGFGSNQNFFGYSESNRNDRLPVASTSEESRFMKTGENNSRKTGGSVAALKELCTVEGYNLVFQARPSPPDGSVSKETYAQVEVGGQTLGKGVGMTWEEAKLQAADEALVTLRSMLGQLAQKRSGSPRSLAPNFSKRFKSDFPRAVQRAPYGRYSRIEGHVP
ncbi:RNA polymerase II C-terminal domain phosphatase-like 1 isoform X2 [Brachypodium distachyon]|uniref:protein-serine/threonine phosphatase n=1 Tax=Brachypodium distachyon TaxID=15368 RepID=A0A2K2D4B0_BRADI|nr:RNA polymerase II C-terminal domain phosphatase-like 1 isoform X2 [Brachypodium distachyon]PNT69120.1 hypothetical protein BRADI_3g49830v3 [Brachypodium distachyon]|eukprot:XP_010235762.1 RNA polymerase II C-terminal domain phosphatase-like 1 isoform X2 [Brachypodium distachyon]